MADGGGIKKGIENAIALYKTYKKLEKPVLKAQQVTASGAAGGVPAAPPQQKGWQYIADKAKDGLITSFSAHKQVKDVLATVKSVKTDGFSKASQALAAKRAARSADSIFKWNKINILGQVGTAVSAVTDAVFLPQTMNYAAKDIRRFAREQSFQNFAAAAVSTTGAVKQTLRLTVEGSRLVQNAKKLNASYKAASAAFKTMLPQASKKVIAAASRSVMKSSIEGVTHALGTEAATKAISKAVLRTGEKAAAAALLKGVTETAVEVGLKAGTRAAAGTASKVLARFTPGLNIAIAAYDTAKCIQTLTDKNASTGKKVCSVVTAVGSILSATNIPVVSQVGAAVSTISSFVSGFFK